MNKIVLLGRLVKDPELRKVENSDKVYTKFTIAVGRNFKSANGERKSDFIPVIMWDKKADIACKYLKKGDMISVSGRLITRSYEDREGIRRYIIEVSVEDFRVVNSGKNHGGTSTSE
ncbi:single-stranded DNA-binding protein [Clostridium tarantellae]|uniref:Single-stranded DNA-binding protein n=1 Tax=Clostridium tarantellae TaxID=39493 RepID=A0A6I1MLM0_9CLOT|nr:single-stranded DNA-binding protein [Clostridium tarantellae]MPQ43132.1 single-stranded DNA-binding protein [Clostridium tarantellae]